MSFKSVSANIAAIIIAAGESRRLNGAVKQLIPWHNKPLILHVIHLAIGNGLIPIHVVLGANCDQIFQVIKDLPVKILLNSDWKKGKGTSISLGISSLPRKTQAAMIFVVDQPFLSAALIQTIKASFYQEGDGVEIIAPYVGEIQANPVLFTKSTFSKLRKLKNEQGGKDILPRFQVKKIQWADKKILKDIDTFEDYVSLSSSSNFPE